MKNVQNNLDLCKDEHNRKNTYIDGHEHTKKIHKKHFIKAA